MRMPGCFDCSQLTSGDCGKHGPYTWGGVATTQPAQGWVCPVCRAVYAPWVASCLQCPKAETPSLGMVEAGDVCPECSGSGRVFATYGTGSTEPDEGAPEHLLRRGGTGRANRADG